MHYRGCAFEVIYLFGSSGPLNPKPHTPKSFVAEYSGQFGGIQGTRIEHTCINQFSILKTDDLPIQFHQQYHSSISLCLQALKKC